MGQMGGKLGLGGRVVVAVLLAGALLFAFAGTGVADGQWTISILATRARPSAPEGDSPGASSLTFPVTVTGPDVTPQDMSVSYTSSEGSTPAFTIPAGTASGATLNMAVPINGNTTPEDDRTMTVMLTGGMFGGGDTTDTVAVGTPSSTGKIVDDDWRITGLSTPAGASASEAGGTIDFQVTLNAAAPPHHAITIDYALADGSGATGAKFGTNYTVTQPSGKQSGTLTFAPGSNVVDVKVQGKNDGAYGYDKSFTMSISNPQGATYAANAPTSETGTITESSPAPSIGFSSGCPTVTGGNLLTIPIRTGGTTALNDPIPASVT